MSLKIISLALLGIFQIASSMPAYTLQDLEVADDTHSVGSYIREVRAAPPDYHRSYDNEGDGEVGYSRKKQGGGKKGYQHFDSYHKKAGDNYEFEKQDSYGQDDEGQKGAYSHRHEQKEKYRAQPKSQKYQESEGDREEKEEKEGADEEEHDHEELREDEADGNGGVEAHGHDKADYVLPEKYTYGEGDEYNF